MAFKLPKSSCKSPLNLDDPKDKKIKPFVDPGAPEGFEQGTWSGSTEVIGTPYEGRAFVGTTGTGSRQPVGKSVIGRSTQRAGLLSEENAYVAGEVQPKSVVGSSQDAIIKGSATIVKPYGSKRVGAKKSTSSPANMVPNYKFTGLKDKVKQNAARNRS